MYLEHLFILVGQHSFISSGCLLIAWKREGGWKKVHGQRDRDAKEKHKQGNETREKACWTCKVGADGSCCKCILSTKLWFLEFLLQQWTFCNWYFWDRMNCEDFFLT